MSRRTLFSLSCLLLSGVCVRGLAEDKKPAPPATPSKAIPATADTASPEAIAHRIWLLTDLVLERHVNPPARQGAKLPVRIPGMKVSIAATAQA